MYHQHEKNEICMSGGLTGTQLSSVSERDGGVERKRNLGEGGFQCYISFFPG